MTEGERDRRGTFWDWPTGWMLAGLVLVLISASNGASGGMAIGMLIAAVGALGLAARRGAFSPRQRP